MLRISLFTLWAPLCRIKRLWKSLFHQRPATGTSLHFITVMFPSSDNFSSINWKQKTCFRSAYNHSEEMNSTSELIFLFCFLQLLRRRSFFCFTEDICLIVLSTNFRKVLKSSAGENISIFQLEKNWYNHGTDYNLAFLKSRKYLKAAPDREVCIRSMLTFKDYWFPRYKKW